MADISGNDQIFLDKLKGIILANLGNENFGVDDLAKEAGITTHTLRNRLHDITNKNIAQFIRETRLLKSLEILKNERLTAAEVAYKTGFSSPTYFNTCFHEYFGYSPGEVKKGTIKSFGETDQTNKIKKIYQRKRIWIRTILALFFILLILFFAITGFYQRASRDPKDSENKVSSDPKSVAVIPFNNLGDNNADQYIIDGIMEEILYNLGRIHELRIVSRISVEQYRKSNIPASEIAKRLNVEYIVEGNGQVYGNSLRLWVKITEGKKDIQIFNDSYQVELRRTEDIFKLQSQIAQKIASALKTSFTPLEKEEMEKTSTYSLTAYDFFQRGRNELVKVGLYGEGIETLARAEYLLRKALAYDPQYAQAYSSLSNIYWSRFDFVFNSPDFDINVCNRYLDSMRIMADLALSFDHRLLDARNAMGFYYCIKGTPDQALAEWDKAIKYNPNDFFAYSFKSRVYFYVDMLKSIEYNHKAASHNDGSTLPSSIRVIAYRYFEAGFPEQGNFYLLEALKLDDDSIMYSDIKNMLGRDKKDPIENAIYYMEERCKTNPNSLVYFCLGYYNLLLGLNQESLNYFKKIDAAKFALYYPQYNYIFRTWLGFTCQKNGYTRDADSCFSNHIDMCTKKMPLIPFWYRPNALYGLAGAYLCMGNKQKAYEILELLSQYESYGSEYVYWLKNDPVFSGIRNEPEYQKIVKDVENKYLAQHEKVGKWLNEGALKN